MKRKITIIIIKITSDWEEAVSQMLEDNRPLPATAISTTPGATLGGADLGILELKKFLDATENKVENLN